MAADRQSSTMVAAATPAPDDNNHLFLDILHEAPLFGHRNPTSILGSIFYCILLVMLFLLLELHGSFVLKQNWFHLCSVAAMSFFWLLQAYFSNILSTKSRRYGYSYQICRIIMLAEVICAGFFIVVYIGYVHQYNALDSQPDVLKSLYSPLQPSSSLEELRYHEGGRLSDRQMALLQHQRENRHFLNEEILKLQECLSKCKRSDDGSTPQVDLAHLLAARYQELRTVSAEYIEENERLRAILGERSTRAAKLERALEAEWMSNLDLRKKLATTKS